MRLFRFVAFASLVLCVLGCSPDRLSGERKRAKSQETPRAAEEDRNGPRARVESTNVSYELHATDGTEMPSSSALIPPSEFDMSISSSLLPSMDDDSMDPTTMPARVDATFPQGIR